jgi:hypothetical protein
MGYTTHWELKGLRKQNYGELSDVIIGTNWKVTITDEDGIEGSFSGATPFRPVDVNIDNFTSYNELTETQVLSWVKHHVSGSNASTNYWEHILGRAQKEIDAKKYSIEVVGETELPWSTGSLEVTPDPLSGRALYPASAD